MNNGNYADQMSIQLKTSGRKILQRAFVLSARARAHGSRVVENKANRIGNSVIIKRIYNYNGQDRQRGREGSLTKSVQFAYNKNVLKWTSIVHVQGAMMAG